MNEGKPLAELKIEGDNFMILLSNRGIKTIKQGFDITLNVAGENKRHTIKIVHCDAFKRKERIKMKGE